MKEFIIMKQCCDWSVAERLLKKMKKKPQPTFSHFNNVKVHKISSNKGKTKSPEKSCSTLFKKSKKGNTKRRQC